MRNRKKINRSPSLMQSMSLLPNTKLQFPGDPNNAENFYLRLFKEVLNALGSARVSMGMLLTQQRFL